MSCPWSLVAVYWIDAFDSDNGWIDLDHYKPEACHVVSIGFLWPNCLKDYVLPLAQLFERLCFYNRLIYARRVAKHENLGYGYTYSSGDGATNRRHGTTRFQENPATTTRYTLTKPKRDNDGKKMVFDK